VTKAGFVYKSLIAFQRDVAVRRKSRQANTLKQQVGVTIVMDALRRFCRYCDDVPFCDRVRWSVTDFHLPFAGKDDVPLVDA